MTASAVTLTTLHKAKGLEWESVILVRLTEGSLPSAYAVTDTLVAEEQRLAYVGITRAARLLTCTYATSRTSGKRTWSTTPSRFLAEAGLHPTRAASTPSRSARAARPAAAALNGPQQQVLTALLAWRAAEAARCRLPDFAVLSDEILRAVAASTASDRLGLLRVHGLGLAKVNAYGDSLLAALLAARR